MHKKTWKTCLPSFFSLISAVFILSLAAAPLAPIFAEEAPAAEEEAPA